MNVWFMLSWNTSKNMKANVNNGKNLNESVNEGKLLK